MTGAVKFRFGWSSTIFPTALNELTQEALTRLSANLRHPIGKSGKAHFVPAGSGRRLAVSDIHGCYETFENLLDKTGLTKSDQLFILGDFIDRGPYSRAVIDRVERLLAEGYSVFPLRGNHEQLFLEYRDKSANKLKLFAQRQNSRHLLKSGNRLSDSMQQFFSAMPYYYETDAHLLVHAGFNTVLDKPLKSWHDMLWIRKFDYLEMPLKAKRVVHGHVPQTLKRISRTVENDGFVWAIDNGCVRSRHSGFGRLVCVDLDSGKLYKTKNADTLPCR